MMDEADFDSAATVAHIHQIVNEFLVNGVLAHGVLDGTSDGVDVLGMVATGSAPAGTAFEAQLLGKCLKEVQRGNVAAEVAQLYIRLRCAVRAWSMMAPAEVGLAAFTTRFALVSAFDLVDRQDVVTPENARGPGRKKMRWIATQVQRQMQTQGCHAEFRTSLGNNVAEVSEAVESILCQVTPPVRFGLVQQLRRTKNGGAQLASVEAVVGWRREHPRSAELIGAVDLAGPEVDAPPWGFEECLRLAKDSGLRVYVHAGETYPHALVGLHWLAWTLTAVPLAHGDRVGHGLVLLDVPRSGVVRVRDWAFALAWAIDRVGRVDSLVRAFRRVRSSFPALPMLETWLTGGLAVWRRYNNAERWCVAEDEIDIAVWNGLVRRLQRQMSRQGVVRESCPTSNRQVCGWPHRFREAHAHQEVATLIGTDDPGLLGTGLAVEFAAWLTTKPGRARVEACRRLGGEELVRLRMSTEWRSLLVAHLATD